MNPPPPLGELGSATVSGNCWVPGGRHQGDAADRVEVNGSGHTEPLRPIGRIGEDSGELGAPEGLSGRITGLWSFLLLAAHRGHGVEPVELLGP
jgi:hypothetical protein